MIMLLALILCTVPAGAVPQLPHSYTGKAYVGGVVAPQTSAIRAVAGTSGIDWNTTVQTGTGDWTLDITFDDTDTVGTVEGMTVGETVTWYLRTVQATTSQPTTGSTTDPFNLTIAASCSDGLENGDETGVDCGGSCPLECYAKTAALSAGTLSIHANNNGTTVLTITNTGANALTGLTVTVPAFSPTAGAITITFTAPATGLAFGANVQVTLNVTVAVNTTEDRYVGTINVTDDNGTIQQAVITIDTTSASEIRRKTRRIEVGVAGLEGAPICLGLPVVVTLVDESRGEPIKKADVDVYLGNEARVKFKVFYGETDDMGEYKFTPTEAGDYLITASGTRYKLAELTVTVAQCGETTSTMPMTTTMPIVITTTSVTPYTTSTVTATTTVMVVTTTVTKVATTTVTAPTPPATPGKSSTGTIIIVIIIVIVVAAIYLKSKGGGTPPAEPPAE